MADLVADLEERDEWIRENHSHHQAQSEKLNKRKRGEILDLTLFRAPSGASIRVVGREDERHELPALRGDQKAVDIEMALVTVHVLTALYGG